MADDVTLEFTGSGPYVACRARTIVDPAPGGNGDGKLDPGETADYVLALANVGTLPATDIETKLATTDPYVSVVESLCTYGTIDPESTRTNEAAPFQVSAAPGCPLEHVAAFQLIISGGYNDTVNVTIEVGEIRAIDPIPDGPRQPPLYWAYDDTDTNYAAAPVFSWMEISAVGTMLTLSDDETQPVSLPAGFIWRFYDQDYTQLSICGNGWVAPGSTTIADYSNTPLPNPAMPPMVAPCWDDLFPPAGGGVWYYHDVANQRFVIEWDSVAYFGNQSMFDKYEVIIYDTTEQTQTGNSDVLVQYLTANAYNSNTVGIQDPTATIGINCLTEGVYHRGTAPLAPGRAIKFSGDGPQTAIAEQPGNGRRAAAFRATPNPFHGAVTLSSESARGPITARVFDNSGRVVRTLSAGTAVVWNGLDDNGRAVPPGIYFCRLTAGGLESGIKLILAR